MATQTKTNPAARRVPATKPPRPRKRTQAEALAAADEADRTAERVARMTPAQRAKLFADFERWRAESAPTAESARSDLLTLLIVVGTEFAKRYYPDATEAHLHISRREGHNHLYGVHVPFCRPLSIPAAEEVKDVVRRYANDQHPGWRAGFVSVSLGEFAGEDDRHESLLVDPARK